MKTVLVPYVNFMGKAKEAMEFYKSIFGGELNIQTFKDAGFPHKPDEDIFVIHAELKAPEFTLMASDGNEEHQVHMGDNVHLSLIGSEETQLKDYFAKLSEGGTVGMPLEKQFWGDVYGQLTDKFGLRWDINISSGEQTQK